MILNNSYCLRDKKPIFTESGKRYKNEYVWDVDKSTGEKILVKSGEIDLQALYDSHLPDCDMSRILTMLLENGVDPKKISISDEIDDYTSIQNATVSDLMAAAAGYKDNLAKYEAIMKELESKTTENPEVTDNAK